MFSPAQSSTTPRRRILAAVGMFVLGVALAAPLFAALSLCTMPCCRHNNDTGLPIVGADMSGCMPECSVRVDDATQTAVRTVGTERGGSVSAESAASVVVAVAAPPARVAVARDTGGHPRAAGAPLHVLNSLFRI